MSQPPSLPKIFAALGEDYNATLATALINGASIRAADGEAIGVFEVDTDVTELSAEIAAAEVFNFAILVLCFGAIYGLSLATVAAGSRMVARQHQENLELAAAMARTQAANRAKSEFLANLSHELRTPLNAIVGFSEIITDQSFGPIEPSRYRDYAVEINKSGRCLLDIIDDVLDLVKIGAGRAQPVLSEVDPARLIDAAVTRIRDQAEAAEVNLTLRLTQELPSISTDPRRRPRPAPGQALHRAPGRRDRDREPASAKAPRSPCGCPALATTSPPHPSGPPPEATPAGRSIWPDLAGFGPSLLNWPIKKTFCGATKVSHFAVTAAIYPRHEQFRKKLETRTRPQIRHQRA